MVELDRRLETMAGLVARGSVAADIGTDHGYLIVSLVQRGIISRGYATDLRPKPLAKAQLLVRANGLGDRITCLLCDGLKEVPHDAGEILIGGMGGDLIATILEEAPWIRKEKPHLILQPMTKAEHLRQYLAGAGFRIDREIPVESEGFVYSVLSVWYDGVLRTLPEWEILMGKTLEEPEETAGLYYRKIKTQLDKKIRGLRRSKDPGEADRIEKLIETIEEERRRQHGERT